MAEEFFMNPFPYSLPTLESLSSQMEIQPTHHSQPPNCFLSPPPPPPDHFESPLSSMVSSPSASTSAAVSVENFIIRELIGKLGNICSAAGAPPPLPPYIGGGNQSAANSSYSTPLSSPPKMNDSFPNLPAMPGDPGFAERAARFSSFGSRSFNGRTSQIRANNNNGEFGNRPNGANFGAIGTLQRVSSSPALKAAAGSQAENNKNSGNFAKERRQTANSGLDQGEWSNSRENSSVSGQNPGVENGSSRKRKTAPKGKIQSPLPANSNKVAENGEGTNAKRSKTEEVDEAKTEENRGEESKKQSNKPPEPPKDYIHVRARRGQATDSHSLAERVRREKISERMKLLQDLVPGCNKVTGKALMLDEIINYVQSLQRQVEFLSMKLASVNQKLEFSMDGLFSKDVIQPNCSTLPHPMYPLDSLAQIHYSQPQPPPPPPQPHQNNVTTTGVPCSPMDPLNPTLHQNHAFQLPPLDAFPNAAPQIPSLCEGDLQCVVQMGYGQKENGSQSQILQGANQTPLMKIEF